MKNLLLIIGTVILRLSISAQPVAVPLSHEKWDQLLQKYVSASGEVDYKSILNNRIKLEEYLHLLRTTHPAESWSRADKMAYWINAYNAFTIVLILDHYPLKSINDIKKDGKKAWDIPFIKIETKTYTLNNIEHDILRKDFADPRIHFAVNCASFSCPPLMNNAFTAKNLTVKLDELARKFINDPKRNKITAKGAELSEIFNWFKDDFTKKGSLIDFLNKYSTVKLAANSNISYLEYNWSLNNKP